MRLGHLMLSVLLLALSTSSQPPHWDATKEAQDGCDYLDASPFFRNFPQRYHFQGATFLMEYARFMNKMAPVILKEFVKQKKLLAATEAMEQIHAMKTKMDSRNDLGFNTTGSISGGVSGTLDSATTDLLGVAQQIIGALAPLAIGIKKDEALSPSIWDLACKTEWWPFEDNICSEARCMVCTPAIHLAEAVCRLTDREKSFRCLQNAMGEGYCNYCIVEFMGE